MSNYRIVERCDNFYDVIGPKGGTINIYRLSSRYAAQQFIYRMEAASRSRVGDLIANRI